MNMQEWYKWHHSELFNAIEYQTVLLTKTQNNAQINGVPVSLVTSTTSSIKLRNLCSMLSAFCHRYRRRRNLHHHTSKILRLWQLLVIARHASAHAVDEQRRTSILKCSVTDRLTLTNYYLGLSLFSRPWWNIEELLHRRRTRHPGGHMTAAGRSEKEDSSTPSTGGWLAGAGGGLVRRDSEWPVGVSSIDRHYHTNNHQPSHAANTNRPPRARDAPNTDIENTALEFS